MKNIKNWFELIVDIGTVVLVGLLGLTLIGLGYDLSGMVFISVFLKTKS